MESASKPGSQSMGVERGFAPSQGQGTASLVGFGATPQLFRVKPIQREKSSKVAAAKRPAPKLRASSDAPPSCSFQRLCCVAQMARPNCLSFRHGCLFPQAGISRLRARVGGFAVAPDTSSQCTPMFLGLYRCRGFRLCGGDKGRRKQTKSAIAPLTPSVATHVY